MSTAIIVKDVYKKFGQPAAADRFSWLPWRKSAAAEAGINRAALLDGASTSQQLTINRQHRTRSAKIDSK